MKTKQLILSTLILIYAFNITTRSQSTNTDLHSLNLMPVPASVQLQSGRLDISAGFTVSTAKYSDARLQAAIERIKRRLQGRTGLTFAEGVSTTNTAATLVVECERAGESVPSVDENESYKLDVSSQQAHLTAPTVVGALRGLETFLQLVVADRDGYYLPAVKIDDAPRFPWRGLLIDIGRHYEPPEVLKRNLDAMAAVKLNVFHWHITEDQGFRIESKKFPKLTQLGSDGLYYTQEQAREIIAYAQERGIRVVPEFDIPGHSTSWLVAYPELGSAPGPYSIERQAGIFEPALDPTREEVYQFLDKFLGEMAALFPDAYMHIGGDENEGKQWSRNPQIQEFMKKNGIADNHALQAYFNKRLMKILEKHKKKMIGWDEILQPDLPKTALIQSWRGTAALADAARQGYDGILSNGYYIDLSFPTSQHYASDPIPANSTLTPEQAKHILGGEATMWGEYVGPETIDSRIWPRTAAIAERLWSPQTVTDVNDMYRRLSVVSIELEELGLTHKRNVNVLLRRLARSENVGTLQTLASVVEPVKEYRRGAQRPATMNSPLSGLVDAAQPDSEAARKFDAMVNGLLSDAPRFQLHAENIRETLRGWRDTDPSLGALMENAPALHEAQPLAKDLSDLGELGLEAISYLATGTTPPANWASARLARLDEAAKPKAALEFATIGSLRKLVVAASELGQLKSMTAEEWRQHVTTLAIPAKK